MCCIGCNDFIGICSGFQAAEANIGIQIADVIGLCIRSYGLSCHQLVVAVVNANRHALQVGRCRSDCSSNRNYIADLDIRNGHAASNTQGIRCGGTAIRNGELLIDYGNICICCIRCNDFVIICSGFQIAKADICIQIADIVGFGIRCCCLSGYQLVVAVINTNRHALQVGRCGSDCSSNRNHIADLDIRNGHAASHAQLIRCGGTAIRNGELLIDYGVIRMGCIRYQYFIIICTSRQSAKFYIRVYF